MYLTMPLRHASLRRLRVFEAVARHRSFSRAAAELHLTQPAVSMQVRQLEEEIGLSLVEQNCSPSSAAATRKRACGSR
jgi:DNA-binding transcriptional LysR family regulator